MLGDILIRTPTLLIDEELVLRPTSSPHLPLMKECWLEESESLHKALPWLRSDHGLEAQFASFFAECSDLSRMGGGHQWVIINKGKSGRLIGLIGFDSVCQSRVSDWNMGYWIRSNERNRGVATRAIEAIIKWASEVFNRPFTIEVNVDPMNVPAKACVDSLVRKYGGERYGDGDREVTIKGVSTLHICNVFTIA